MLTNKERLIWIFITLLGIVITFFSKESFNSGMEVSITATPTIARITITPISCLNYSHSDSEIEMQANDWFTSENPQTLSRDQYNTETSDWIWDWFCEQYQKAIITNESWLNDPLEMAMRSRGYPLAENSGPDIVKAIFGKSALMAIVTLTYTNLPDDSIQDAEWRIDLVEVSRKVWNIQWMGYRLRCRQTGSDAWIADRCL